MQVIFGLLLVSGLIFGMAYIISCIGKKGGAKRLETTSSSGSCIDDGPTTTFTQGITGGGGSGQTISKIY